MISPLRVRLLLIPMLLALGLAGCAGGKVTERDAYQGKLPRPQRVLVYDVAPTQADLPPAMLALEPRVAPALALTPDQTTLARTLGAAIAQDLIGEVNAMGLPAVAAAAAGPMVPGDYAVAGFFTAVQAGSAAERVAVGFGEGAAKLVTVARGYRMTAEGLRLLGSGTVDATSGQMPGGAAPLVLAVATGNPLGLVVTGAARAYGEASSSETIEGAAQNTAKTIGQAIREQAQRQGWI